jgi:hypothetical protein
MSHEGVSRVAVGAPMEFRIADTFTGSLARLTATSKGRKDDRL